MSAGAEGPCSKGLSHVKTSIQISKTACCVGMVLTHGLFWATTSRGQFLFPVDSVLGELAPYMTWIAFFPLLLPFTAGCIYALSSNENTPSKLESTPFASIFWEACGLVFLGTLMNFLAGGWYALKAWNVLQFIAVALIVIWILLRIGGRWALTIAALAVLLGTDFLRPWLLEHSKADWALILVGDPRDFHSWPILPWLPMMIAGFLIADLTFCAFSRRGIFLLLFIGSALVAISAVTGSLIPEFVPSNFIGPEVMHPRTLRSVGIVGLGFLLLGSAGLAAPYVKLAPRGFVHCFSRGILWIYLLHMIVGSRLARILDKQINPAELTASGHPVFAAAYIFGFLLFLLAFSWAVGWLSIVLLSEKRIEIRLRRAT